MIKQLAKFEVCIVSRSSDIRGGGLIIWKLVTWPRQRSLVT